MNPADPNQPAVPQPGTIINPGMPPSAPPPSLEPDPAPPDDPRPPVQTPVPETPQQPALVPQTPPTVITDPGDDAIIAWQASEYLHHDKKASWYIALFLIIAALIGVAVFTHQWLSIGVFVGIAGALVVYGNKAPRVLNYALGDRGISIEGRFYPYESFRSFGVMQDIAWHLIDLEPMRRFMPRLEIMFEDNRRDQIVEILSEHMPRQDRQPDLVERAARYLHF